MLIDSIGPLAGRVALVTGASGGIGGAIALRLADAGCDLGLTFARRPDSAETVATQIRALGVRTVTIQADLSSPRRGVEAIDEIEQELGPVRVFVANAGLGIPVREIGEVDVTVWHRTMAVNVEAPFLQAQRLAPAMVADGFGRMLFVSSTAAFAGGLIGPHYAASKAALHGLVAWLSKHHAANGITVNAVAPALIADTEMLPDAPLPPVGRFGTPDHVADVALTMLRNPYVTGKVWSMDGGLHTNQ